MNTAKVYLELKRLAGIGLVSIVPGQRATEYLLDNRELRALVLELSPKVISLDEWSSARERAKRFRSGIFAAPEFDLGSSPSRTRAAKPSRLPGELEALALLARAKFQKKYERVGDREFARL